MTTLELDSSWPPGVNTIKHQFVQMRLATPWVLKPATIAVNQLLQVSFDGGDWHGSAEYLYDEAGGGRWIMKYHYKAVLAQMKTVVFSSITGTDCFLNVQNTDPAYNSILMPSPIDTI